jgi:hypothetical protein
MVQVIGGGQALQAVLLKKVLSARCIGDVQRIIPDASAATEELELIVNADQVTVGLTRGDLAQNPLFAGLGDPRRGNEDRPRTAG